MRTLFDITLPDDQSGREFEEMCLTVYSRDFHTRDAMYYNRGHGQHGVDILLLDRSVRGASRRIVIQCKDVEKLLPSAIAPNLRQALAHWGPHLPDDPDLLVIVATTAKRPKASTIQKAFQELRNELLPTSLHRKVEILVHGWDDITTIIRRDADLQDLFRARGQYDPPDEPLHYQELADSIMHCIARGELGEAQKYWTHAEAEAKTRGGMLSPCLLQAAVRLLLAAGDFAALDDTLRHSLTRRTVDAAKLVAFFRARRFTSMVPCHKVELAEFLKMTLPQLSFGDLMERYERYLLTAHGTLGAKLTLALWMTVHGDEAVAARGLLRAFSLVRQHWPVPCALPGPDRPWTIVDGRLAPLSQADHAALNAPASGDERLAVVLTYAYEFLRGVHAERFGRATTVHREKEAGGWTDFYPDPLTSHISVHTYFGPDGVFPAGFDARAQFAEAGLVDFYDEAMRMTADWTVVCLIGDTPCEVRWPRNAGVCTWRVLLLDAETGHGHRRREELFLRAPAHAVEHVLAVARMLEIGDLAASSDNAVGPTLYAWRRSRLHAQLARMTRRENAEAVTGRIEVRAVYVDRPQQSGVGPVIPEALEAAIAMSNKSCPLLATVDDWSLALAHSVEAVVPYWLWKDEANPRHEGHRDSLWYGAHGTGFWPDPV